MKTYYGRQTGYEFEVMCDNQGKKQALASVWPGPSGDRIPLSMEADSPGREALAFLLVWSATGSFTAAFLWYQEFDRVFMERFLPCEFRTTDEEICSWIVKELAVKMGFLEATNDAPTFYIS